MENFQIVLQSFQTPQELKDKLSKTGIKVSSYAEEMIDKLLPREKAEKVELVVKTVEELGFENGATTEQIYTKAKELGLELCPRDTAIFLRLFYNNQPMNEYLFIAMETISGPGGDPHVFFLHRGGDGVWLESGYAEPDKLWFPGPRFVFRLSSLRKSLGNLDTPDSLALSPLDTWKFCPFCGDKLKHQCKS